MKNQETMSRKKLYKSGKLWVTAGVSLIVALGMSVEQVSADVTQDNSVVATKKIINTDQDVPNASTQVKTVNDSGQNTVTTNAATQPNSTQDTNDQTIGQISGNTVPNQNQNTDINAKTAQIKPSAGVKTVTDVLPANDQTVNSQKDTNNDQIATDQKDANNIQVTNAQKDNNVATKIDDSVPTKSQTEAQTNNTTSVKESDQSAKKSESNQYHSKNIQTIDGKTYYIDDNGQVTKNFTTVVDGQVLYFDKETGVLSPTNDYQFKQGLTSQNNSFTAHNAVENTTKDNFTEIDGYLTADSWYRPTDILVNGKNWAPSTDKDFRPLLMSWWPDKATQVNYLNYMKNTGLSDSSVDFSVNDDQSALNQAGQDVQIKIEQKISQVGQTSWLQRDISNFVDSQSNWNINSEYETTGDAKDHLQGGALRYVNSDKTPAANSDYRLLNRTPTNQKGYASYSIDPTQGGYDFLLANDVDNSNPVVQAEQLNWMHYLLNFGSITNQDADANFDSIRVDAVDNVDADLLQIAADYMKAAYGVDENDATANQHLSILEDWSDNDAAYVKDNGNNQLSMDNKLRLSLKYSLTMPLTDQNGNAVRSGLEPLITNSLVDRTSDTTDNVAQPNYSFVRAHDSEVQTVIAEIIKEKIDANSDGLTPTIDQLEQAFKIYNADQLKTDKEFTQFNIPSTYALLLTNKDTIPRVYYGDLYTDDGQYMSNKSPYYDAINTLLQSRLKYVSGGQNMSMAYMTGDSSMSAQGNRGLLTSVRYGKDAMTADDKGTAETRTQGIAVIEGNNPDLKLSTTDQVILKMGAAHKKQAYRPAIMTTSNGLITYLSDSDVNPSLIKYTTNNGELIFNQSDIKGFANPQVSGYLSVWVPVGASDIQDARTASSDTQSVKDGQTLHSNAALDSQVIYEGFSNFQYFPTTESEYTNVIIAKNTDLYQAWGVTSFEFPPQYRSSTEGSFLDSIIQNGYAFTDRYDLGFNTPTKYGTVDQLRDAIKALHATGIKAMADWVPDQIYNLTGKQIVTAERVNNSGVYNENSVINKTLYAAEIVGGGDYQKLYGGAFLDKIKSLYPSLFTTKQISTGVPMDPSTKIKEWSAKYFNGSNIQGRGAYYVLKDWATNDYFQVSSADKNNDFLPKQLMNKISNTGFVSDNKGMIYFSTSGYQAKDTFIQDEKSNWYYFDKNGYLLYGLQTINDASYYFLPNGIELQDAYLSNSNGDVYYFNKQGKQTVNDYFMDSNKDWRYFDKNGVMARGLTTIKSHIQYFNQDGTQIKDKFITDTDGHLRYFTVDSGDVLTNQFKKLADGSWAYFGGDGLAVKGQQTINGQNLYFDDNYHQVKGHEQADKQGILRFYDANSGEMIKNRFEKVSNNSWVYFDATGQAVKGYQTINGQKLYFGNDSYQIKGHETVNSRGQIQFYDENSGEMITNRFEKLSDGSWAYFDATGQAVKGYQTINGQNLYFDDNYHQVKGQAVVDNQGTARYYDINSGAMVTDHFEKVSDGSWRYFGNDGKAKVSQPTV